MKDNCCSYSLKDISEWQLNIYSKDISLPPLQRGFVWKVNQIEALWDSLLRDFPIGSFLLSKNVNGKQDLLDGQQRATSIALGYYDPWTKEEYRIGSFKKNPLVWIDLTPSKFTDTQKFVIRVITQSHPWGYQRKSNDKTLSAADKNKAINIFRDITKLKTGYTQLPLSKVFPFDADLPIPLCFIFKAVLEGKSDWKNHLLSLCKSNLSPNIRTKYFEDKDVFFDKIANADFNSVYIKSIYDSINSLSDVKIPGIFVAENVLFEDDGATADPTLFIRFNRGGTRIEGEELIYSIYKAAYPSSKDLVENIQANYLAPSRVITLVSRLVENSFSKPVKPAQFKKKIREDDFKNKLQEIIGNANESKLKTIFYKAINLLHSENEFALPPVLVKNIVNDNNDLFYLLLKWLQLNYNKEIGLQERKNILAVITALAFFGNDNSRYVREVWDDLENDNFWNVQRLKRKYIDSNEFIMFPIKPESLRCFLLKQVVDNKLTWDTFSPFTDNDIIKQSYFNLLNNEVKDQDKAIALNGIWDFINNLYVCRPLVLFAQREYINNYFGDFNQMESLEDTNAPWDWDHIYPESWVYYKQTFSLIKDWNNCIGNFRVLSFETNRSENNIFSPKKRLGDANIRKDGFVKEDDWKWWQEIDDRIYKEDKVQFHSSAVINRMVNIYAEWYKTLELDELFQYSES